MKLSSIVGRVRFRAISPRRIRLSLDGQTRHDVVVVVSLLVAALSGCPTTAVPCNQDADCAPTEACLAGVCGARPDRVKTDGGIVVDDGGNRVDGGFNSTLDGGNTVDGGSLVDGGSPVDGGGLGDGGVSEDAGPLCDNGSTPPCGLPAGAVCANAAECASDVCGCGDETCGTTVCAVTSCPTCTFALSDGLCTGAIAPLEACDDDDDTTSADACDGNGVCVGNPDPVDVKVVVTGWSNRAIDDFALTDDGNTAVVMSTFTDASRFDLVAVDIATGDVVKLSSNTAAQQDVVRFALTADGTRVVYQGDMETDERFELYVVNLDGTGHSKLNPPMAGTGGLPQWRLTSDGAHVVFAVGVSAGAGREVWSVRLDDGTSVKLSGPTLSPMSTLALTLSNNGQWVAYVADESVPGLYEVRLAPVDGSAPSVRVHDLATVNAETRLSFVLDDTAIVYAASHLGGVEQIDLVSITGELPSTAATVSPLTAQTSLAHRVSANGRQLAFTNGAANGSMRLFLVDLESTTAVDVTPDAAAGGTVGHFAFTDDGTTLLFLAESGGDGKFELWAKEVDGGPSHPVVIAGDGESTEVSRFFVSPASTHVAVAHRVNDDAFERLALVDLNTLESVDVGPENPTVIDRPMFTPDGRFLVYLADDDRARIREMYAVDVDTHTRRRVNEPLPGFGDVFDYRLPRSGGVLYVADDETNGVDRLRFMPRLDRDGGGGTPDAVGATSTLVNAGLVTRYFLDDGPGSTTLLDDAGDDAILGVPAFDLSVVSEGNLHVTGSSRSGGLAFRVAGVGGEASAPIDGSKIAALFDDVTTVATVETVVDLDDALDSPSRLVYFGTGTSGGDFLTLTYSGDAGFLTFRPDVDLTSRGHRVATPLLGRGRVVITQVVDTAVTSALLRVKTYIDGRHVTHFDENGAAPTLSGALTPTPGNTFFIGNRAGRERSPSGRISYVAVYKGVLTEAQVRTNADRLLRSDDDAY